MARCKFCNENIDWVNIHGKWEPRDRSGKPHRCQHNIDRTATLVPIVSAVCVKCWKPLIGSTNICNCLNPLRIHKREAKKLKLYEQSLPGRITIAAINKREEEYYKRFYSSTLLINPFHPFSEVTAKTGNGEYILFHGNLSVPENVRSFLFLNEHIFSKIQYRVIVAGKNPAHEIRRKVSQSEKLELISNPDVKAAYFGIYPLSPIRLARRLVVFGNNLPGKRQSFRSKKVF